MTILLLRQLFKQAEDTDMELECDFSAIEDQAALEQIEKSQFDGPLLATSKKDAKLLSIKDAQQRLVEENQALEDKVAELQAELRESRRDLAEAQGQNQALEGDLQAAGMEGRRLASGLEAKAQEVAEAKVEFFHFRLLFSPVLTVCLLPAG